jgi:TonB family protein
MRRFPAMLIGLLLLGTMPGPRLLAQEFAGGRKVVSKVIPLYPELARRLKLDGTVKLEVTVAPNGAAKKIDVVGGNPVLVKAAEDAVSNYHWAAGTQESREEVEIRFHRPGN